MKNLNETGLKKFWLKSIRKKAGQNGSISKVWGNIAMVKMILLPEKRFGEYLWYVSILEKGNPVQYGDYLESVSTKKIFQIKSDQEEKEGKCYTAAIRTELPVL